MTLSSLVNQSRAMLEEQARHLLTESERQTMGYYVEEYRDGHIGVEQLVMALFELLNTHAKVRDGEALCQFEKGKNKIKSKNFPCARICTVVQSVCVIAVRFELKLSVGDLFPGFLPMLTVLFSFSFLPGLKVS